MRLIGWWSWWRPDWRQMGMEGQPRRRKYRTRAQLRAEFVNRPRPPLDLVEPLVLRDPTRPASERGRGRVSSAWAPFQTVTGAWSQYVIDPMAESILEWVQGVAGQPESPLAFLLEAQFQPLLDRWARSEARRMRYESLVGEAGEVDKAGNPHKLMEQLSIWEKRSAYHAERCGLDPLALAKIQRELAELHREQDVSVALSEMQARYARRPRLIAEEPAEERQERQGPAEAAEG